MKQSWILWVLSVCCVFACAVGFCGARRPYAVVIRSESANRLDLRLSFEQGQGPRQSEQIMLGAHSRDNVVSFDYRGSPENAQLRVEAFGPSASGQALFEKKGLSGRSLHLVIRQDGTLAEEPNQP